MAQKKIYWARSASDLANTFFPLGYTLQADHASTCDYFTNFSVNNFRLFGGSAFKLIKRIVNYGIYHWQKYSFNIRLRFLEGIKMRTQLCKSAVYCFINLKKRMKLFGSFMSMILANFITVNFM